MFQGLPDKDSVTHTNRIKPHEPEQREEEERSTEKQETT